MTRPHLRPCLEHGCPELTTRSRCEYHERQHEQTVVERRGTATARGYDRAWQELAAEYRRAHPYCERCLRRGMRRKTQIIDHIVALRDGGPRLDRTNLMALCRSCHGFKTAAEVQVRNQAHV